MRIQLANSMHYGESLDMMYMAKDGLISKRRITQTRSLVGYENREGL